MRKIILYLTFLLISEFSNAMVISFKSSIPEANKEFEKHGYKSIDKILINVDLIKFLYYQEHNAQLEDAEVIYRSLHDECLKQAQDEDSDHNRLFDKTELRDIYRRCPNILLSINYFLTLNSKKVLFIYTLSKYKRLNLFAVYVHNGSVHVDFNYSPLDSIRDEKPKPIFLFFRDDICGFNPVIEANQIAQKPISHTSFNTEVNCTKHSMTVAATLMVFLVWLWLYSYDLKQ